MRFDQHPPLLDESVRRRVHAKDDGAYEVVYECEVCAKTFITAAQLTGKEK